MNPFALVVLAGASCLLATYNLSREGSILLSLVVVAVIGATSGAIAMVLCGEKIPHFGRILLAFVTGAMLSETSVFVHYYIPTDIKILSLALGSPFQLLSLALFRLPEFLLCSLRHRQ
jgi:hypothetical protein